jgi:hypothetical protein
MKVREGNVPRLIDPGGPVTVAESEIGLQLDTEHRMKFAFVAPSLCIMPVPTGCDGSLLKSLFAVHLRRKRKRAA